MRAPLPAAPDSWITVEACSTGTRCCADNLSTGSMENIASKGRHFGYRFGRNEGLLAELIDRGRCFTCRRRRKLIVEQPSARLKPTCRERKSLTLNKKSSSSSRRRPRYGKSEAVPFRTRSRDGTNTSIAGRMPAARRSTSSSRWPTGKNGARSSSSLLQHRRSGQTGQWDGDSNFVRQALAGGPSRFGDGTQSFVHHVADVVGALLKLVVEPKAMARSSTSGTPEVTISQLAERVRTLSGSTSSIKLVPYERPMSRASRTCPGACRICRKPSR